MVGGAWGAATDKALALCQGLVVCDASAEDQHDRWHLHQRDLWVQLEHQCEPERFYQVPVPLNWRVVSERENHETIEV